MGRNPGHDLASSPWAAICAGTLKNAKQSRSLGCHVTDREPFHRPSVQFTLFAGFELTKLLVNENRDAGSSDLLDYLARLCEVVRVEMTGTP
jgi:hypothetical protein